MAATAVFDGVVELPEVPMNDVIYLGLIALVFALLVAVLRGVDSL